MWTRSPLSPSLSLLLTPVQTMSLPRPPSSPPSPPSLSSHGHLTGMEGTGVVATVGPIWSAQPSIHKDIYICCSHNCVYFL
ncbi:hypothetical protein EDD21DRAFT_389095 [Dissophora ornata]|nr:hypothetical protein EDD21DRAFT_389095 [Dissophora ornata]